MGKIAILSTRVSSVVKCSCLSENCDFLPPPAFLTHDAAVPSNQSIYRSINKSLFYSIIKYSARQKKSRIAINAAQKTASLPLGLNECTNISQQSENFHSQYYAKNDVVSANTFLYSSSVCRNMGREHCLLWRRRRGHVVSFRRPAV